MALRALADIPGVVDPEAARSAIAKIASAAGAVGPENAVAAVDDLRPSRVGPRPRCAPPCATSAR